MQQTQTANIELPAKATRNIRTRPHSFPAVVGFHLSPVYSVLQRDYFVCHCRILKDNKAEAPGAPGVAIVAHESLQHRAKVLKEGPANTPKTGCQHARDAFV